jgi:sporulation protein YlmC with PRC-barrel domain
LEGVAAVTEACVEILLGKRVVDSGGRKVGRIEEVVAEEHGGELVVVEYLVGRYGLQKRFSIRRFGISMLRMLGARYHTPEPKRIPWHRLDLSDPQHPRTTCPLEELPKS